MVCHEHDSCDAASKNRCMCVHDGGRRAGHICATEVRGQLSRVAFLLPSSHGFQDGFQRCACASVSKCLYPISHESGQAAVLTVLSMID